MGLKNAERHRIRHLNWRSFPRVHPSRSCGCRSHFRVMPHADLASAWTRTWLYPASRRCTTPSVRFTPEKGRMRSLRRWKTWTSGDTRTESPLARAQSTFRLRAVGSRVLALIQR
jgi:hypothetical protein